MEEASEGSRSFSIAEPAKIARLEKIENWRNQQKLVMERLNAESQPSVDNDVIVIDD